MKQLVIVLSLLCNDNGVVLFFVQHNSANLTLTGIAGAAAIIVTIFFFSNLTHRDTSILTILINFVNTHVGHRSPTTFLICRLLLLFLRRLTVKTDQTHRKNRDDEPFKLKGSWKLSIVDLNRLHEMWGVRLTLHRVVAAAIGLVVLSVALGVVLITFTPFSLLLPGYLNRDSRHAYERLNHQTDSLYAVVANQTVYLENMMAVLLPDPEIVENPVVVTDDSIHLIPIDSILPTSEVETEFAARHEEREKYKLSVLTPVPNKILPFVRPVSGATLPDDTTVPDDFRIKLTTPATATVSSCYGGRVIASYFVPGSGATVIIQHPLSFISVYRGLDRANVHDGQKVSSGQALGMMPKENPSLLFELWVDGDMVNPMAYINFN